jgi:hypothetical protein
MDDYQVVKVTNIEGEFEGLNEDVLFKMSDGTAWLQDEYRYWYHYAYSPKVVILKNRETYFAKIDGISQVVAVREIFDFIESQINGEFQGWDGESRYELLNGQVWEQSEYKYEYKYAYMPRVCIFQGLSGIVMQVHGTHAKVRRVR